MSRRVLVVDDEPQIRTVLRAYLEADGFAVAEAGTGAEALHRLGAAGEGIDLVLLDVGLPDLGGLDVLAKIRATSNIFVILVTARSEEVDKLVGLSVGADDYITKPFSPREVVARVKTVLRRVRTDETAPVDDPVLRFDGLTIDPDRREVETESGPVPLSALDFDLLLALATAPGRVYSRTQLLEKVWGYDFYGDERIVDVHIRTMRSALGDDAAAPRIVGTVRGVGYKFLLRPSGGVIVNKLSVRLVVSHLLVALLGAAATFWVVRALAPALFDASLRRNPNPGSGHFGGGQGANQALRDQFAAAVDQSLLIGALVGAVAAAVLGAILAYRVIRPLRTMRDATREMARGRYDVPVELPRVTELAELAADVNTLGRALAETEARRVRLLGEVAHELRTPLTVIDGYVEGMIDGVLPATPRELSQVSEEVRRLRRLGDDLTALSKAEEGRLAMAPVVLDVRDVVAGAAERLRPQAEDAGLTVVVEPGPDPLMVRADSDRLAQVVTNLIGNAFRATEPGWDGDDHLLRDAPEALIAVSDTGVGLEATDLERIFERFYRVPGRRGVGHDTGSGIGLTIARGIVRAHGGDLSAASPGLGEGSTFTVRLPLV